MHYSWDWGHVHFVALDGTSLPYQEKLGAEQLAWLKADLSFQPHGKPLVLFCHQSAVTLKRTPCEVGRCAPRSQRAGDFLRPSAHDVFHAAGRLPRVPHRRLLCGTWWSGPCLDGTPQGFRLIQIKNDRMKTAYTNREGRYPLYVASPGSYADGKSRRPSRGRSKSKSWWSISGSRWK